MTAMEIHYQILDLNMELRVLRGIYDEIKSCEGKTPRQLVLERVIFRTNQERSYLISKLESLKVEVEMENV